ncbi:hypothetical protein OC846_004764 [Tilletia horrida]|uniref:GH16 domain-containing protein n=1 Tax=Tilletia horrida TaxID=155126 RepID=A0AAN6GMP7_9BASI|nr:hypothetical protein OC846_004764 [Tilletia horrida]
MRARLLMPEDTATTVALTTTASVPTPTRSIILPRAKNMELRRSLTRTMLSKTLSTGVMTRSNSWKLVKNIDHTNFFQEMDVFVGDDPSKGMVRYIGMDDARRKGLVNTDNGLIYMALSRRRTNGKYETIRPSTKMTFTEGLVIINVKHMPAACGGWPAIFTVAKDGTWPEKGEIDIAEGVHFYRSNKMSIHTNPGCHMEDWAMSKMLGDLGSESSKNCAAWETQDKGCAVQSSLDDFGISINQNGGGTYMMAWTEDQGIAVYHSARVPADVASGRPDVSRWGKPTAYFPASSCTPSQFFSQHAVTITNTYGGTWAGNDQVWHWKATMDQSCAERTGHNSFWDYFHTGADLSQAYWSIQNIQIWQKQRKP